MASLDVEPPPGPQPGWQPQQQELSSTSGRHPLQLAVATSAKVLEGDDDDQKHPRTVAKKRVASGTRSLAAGPAALWSGQSSLDVFSLDDVGGLPLEVWRAILSYLPIYGLCRAAQVCKSWRHLVASLDATTWRGHYSRSEEWREPAWPLTERHDTTKSWQTLYREHHLAVRVWALGSRQLNQSQCLYVFRKKRERKILRVGPHYEHASLKSALSLASEYDRILLAPGLYDEQFEMSSKIPFELVGEGPLGGVILLTCIEQTALTARLCNLVLRAPWFTAHVLKIVNGHVQVDRCIIEDGQVSLVSPGTAHFRYCSFVRTQVTCSQVSLSLIENCEFTECETCAVVVEGRPQGDANWAHKHLRHRADTYRLRTHGLRQTRSCHEECSVADFDPGSCLSLADNKETDVDCSRADASCRSSYLRPQPDIGITDTMSQPGSEISTDTGEWDSESSCSDATAGVIPAYPATQRPGPAWWSEDATTPPLWDREDQPELASLLRQDNTLWEQLANVFGMVMRQCRISKGQGGVTVANHGVLRIEQSDLCDLQYGVRCLQNAKVVVLENTIHRCSTSGLFLRLGASGVVAGNDIHSTGEAGIDVRKQADPLIQYNRIHHSKRSGVVVLGSGRGTIKANDIYQNREAGIYILYKGDPYVSENRICHGEAAGIAITESGRGYIGGNLISGNRWGGIDVRRGADPRVTHNLVCNGLADGIVIGTKGLGTIDANVVRGNLGCGIWVMSGRPVIQSNQVHSNKDSGIVLVHLDPDGNHSPDESESESEAATESSVLPPGVPNTGATVAMGPYHTHLSFNSVYHNTGHGLVANSTDSVLVSANGFHGNRSSGVYIRQTAHVALRDNSVTCNAGSGVHLAPQAKVELEGNGIYDNIGHGLLVSGEATVIKNDIFYNQLAAVSVEGGATIEMQENRLYSPYDPAVTVQKDTSGCIHHNTIYQGRCQPPIHQPPHTTARIADNTMLPTQGSDHMMRRGADWFLDDPPPRPHVEVPPAISVPSTPARHVTSVTRVMTPAGGNCQQGSKMCILL